MSIQQSITYWTTTAARDYDTMYGLLRLQRYPEALFFGHIVLEKILKALVVQKTHTQAPFTHDLVRLQALAGLSLPQETIRLLNEINDFNVRARYPEYKLEFYKRCTKSFTQRYLKKIDVLYLALCQKLKQKK